MTHTLRILMAVLAVPLLHCGGENGGPMGGSDPDAADADVGDDSTRPVLPTWRLEDIQPASPRAGQTYGLDAFAGQTIVVTLVQGF
jgi:hypothetical protein